MIIKTVSTEYEYIYRNWVYHIKETDAATTIKRTLATDPIWSHGTLTQGYYAGKFAPMVSCTTLSDVGSLERAIALINGD
jgi:hypothetical protein